MTRYLSSSPIYGTCVRHSLQFHLKAGYELIPRSVLAVLPETRHRGLDEVSRIGAVGVDETTEEQPQQEPLFEWLANIVAVHGSDALKSCSKLSRHLGAVEQLLQRVSDRWFRTTPRLVAMAQAVILRQPSLQSIVTVRKDAVDQS